MRHVPFTINTIARVPVRRLPERSADEHARGTGANRGRSNTRANADRGFDKRADRSAHNRGNHRGYICGDRCRYCACNCCGNN